MKLLLAEDDARNRDMLARRLRRRGFDIMEATDGQQAVDVALSSAPDVILMDLAMPRMSGWEAIKHIHAASPHTPIIVLTANSLNDERERAFDLGVHAYLTKPIDFESLLSSLASIAAS